MYTKATVFGIKKGVTGAVAFSKMTNQHTWVHSHIKAEETSYNGSFINTRNCL